jgi:hypothetical protein
MVVEVKAPKLDGAGELDTTTPLGVDVETA